VKIFIEELTKRKITFFYSIVPFLRWGCFFLFYYIYALLACLYLFSIGILFLRNRRFIVDICTHFKCFKILKNSKQKFDIVSRDTEIKERLENEHFDIVGRDAEIKERLENEHFARYVMYLDIMDFLQNTSHLSTLKNPAIIEFGGSNGILELMFRPHDYLIAENYPVVDIQNLSNFKSRHYDFIVLDQILEHVPNPQKAVQEVYRIMKKGGWLITTTPFLIKIHPCPNDYWRFSKEGMCQLLGKFSKIIVKSWGNKDIAINHIKTGAWPTVKEVQQAGCFNLENEEEFPHVVWGFARK
jgi:SAM-dependent methyltransferase